jgi:carbonic anhydrase/acetyltransferase-like protein (isoleucine patch superfamily)
VIRSLDGKTPKIHPTVFVSEASYIVGDVEIGENSSIWPGAVLRGDYGKIVIGKSCSIQDNCVLHTDDYLELGDNVLLTHGAVVHGGKIGSNVLIGVNAAVLEDAQVGNYCLIGAGAIVLSGARVPDYSLVIGVPGRIMALTEKQRQRLEDPTANYVRNARRFIDAGLGLQIPRSWLE